MLNSNEAKAVAGASFKRREEQAREGAKAWTEYLDQQRAEAEKTDRLRALRLARDAGDAAAGARTSVPRVLHKTTTRRTPR